MHLNGCVLNAFTLPITVHFVKFKTADSTPYRVHYAADKTRLGNQPSLNLTSQRSRSKKSSYNFVLYIILVNRQLLYSDVNTFEMKYKPINWLELTHSACGHQNTLHSPGPRGATQSTNTKKINQGVSSNLLWTSLK